MKLRQHTAAPNGRCLWCGSAQLPNNGGWGELTCVERDDGLNGLMPERREFAHEDAEAISARLAELAVEREHAWVARHCAAMQGRTKAECHQCGAGERCQACARTRGKPYAECPLCWMNTAKPCPT